MNSEKNQTTAAENKKEELKELIINTKVSHDCYCFTCKKLLKFENGLCSVCASAVMPSNMVILESPLAGDFERNKRYALWCAYDCYLQGESAYASHLIFTQFLDDKNKDHRNFGIQAGYMWAEWAHEAVFYTDLGMSPGMELAMDEWIKKTKLITVRKLPESLYKLFEQGLYPNGTF